jgi:hypothetical protein
MKTKYILPLLFILFFAGLSKAQLTVHKMVHVGYVYQNQSFVELGGRLLFLEKDDVIYRAGASAMLGNTEGKFVVLPKIQADILLNFQKNVDLYHSFYFVGGAEITTKYIAPKVGVTLFGLVDLTGGYAFPLDKNGINGKELKGLNINFTVNIPIVLLHDLLF